jgi:intracellular sulfur oxidation DsrE/DsrF family protein
MSTHEKAPNSRRGFLGRIATGAAALGIATFTAPLQKLNATPEITNVDDPDEWFKKLKGRHRMVFDVTKPHEMMPFVWPRVFMMTNEMTGSKDNGVVVVLRHDGIPFAFEDRIWQKYNFGQVFKVDDPMTSKPSMRNAFWKPKAGDYKVPGIGNVSIGINELQESGVMFCVCNVAMTVYSAVIADQMKMNAADVMNDWKSGLLPGVQIVPSGVWAVGRAQEHDCKYCYV